MIGVVIWSAEAENKAIIWCEDHGELAYLRQSPHKAASAERFGEGDLIQFDVTELNNLRMAKNPRRIAQHYCCDLSSVISTAGALKEQLAAKSPEPMPDNVIELRPKGNQVTSKRARAAGS